MTTVNWQSRLDAVTAPLVFTILKHSSSKSVLSCRKHGQFLTKVYDVISQSTKIPCSKCRDDLKLEVLKEKLLNNGAKLVSFVNKITTVRCIQCRHKWDLPIGKRLSVHCPICSDKALGNLPARRTKLDNFLTNLKEIHSNTIELSSGQVFDMAASRYKFNCVTCGYVWSTRGSSLVNKPYSGCQVCSRALASKQATKSNIEFNENLIAKHGGLISVVGEYTGSRNVHTFKCSKGHGWDTTAAHVVKDIDTSGCPTCNTGRISRGESELFNWIKTFFPDAQQSVYKIRHPISNNLMQWDVYVPSKSIAIEYNGIYFHSYPRRPKDYHRIKSTQSILEGVRLIHVSDIDWNANKPLVKKTLKHALGITKNSERFYARKLSLNTRPKLTASYRSFYTRNHLQGAPRKGISYTLVDERNAIKAIMTFCPVQSIRGVKSGEDYYELIRYASRGSVVGGASRLFTAFLRDYEPKRILSYSQNDWFEGGLYEQLGFTLIKDCGQDYRTVWGGKLRHKSYTRRNRLPSLLRDSFDPSISEIKNLINNKVPILYDSGKIKWEWRPPVKDC